MDRGKIGDCKEKEIKEKERKEERNIENWSGTDREGNGQRKIEIVLTKDLLEAG